MRDTKVFEIALDDMNYDEESENEMIQSADLADLKLTDDEDRYEPLHSHVKYYNERDVENKKQYPNVFPYLQPYAEEIFNLEREDKPFIAGFKRELDKVSIHFEVLRKNLYVWVKRLSRVSNLFSSKLVLRQVHEADFPESEKKQYDKCRY